MSFYTITVLCSKTAAYTVSPFEHSIKLSVQFRPPAVFLSALAAHYNILALGPGTITVNSPTLTVRTNTPAV